VYYAEQHITPERLPQWTVISSALGHCRPAAVNHTWKRGCGTDGAAVAGEPRCCNERGRETAESSVVAADNRENCRRFEEIYHCIHSLPQRSAKCESYLIQIDLIAYSDIVLDCIGNYCNVQFVVRILLFLIYCHFCHAVLCISVAYAIVRCPPVCLTNKRCRATHQWLLFMTESLNVTPKRKELNLVVCIGKSEAEVTNNKRLHSRYCTAEANYRQTRNISRPLCDSRASCITCVRLVCLHKMHQLYNTSYTILFW